MSKLILNIELLGTARLARGWSLRELARQSGLSLSTVWKSCRHGDVGLTSMRLLCQALDLELRDTLVDARTGRPWSAVERGPM